MLLIVVIVTALQLPLLAEMAEALIKSQLDYRVVFERT